MRPAKGSKRQENKLGVRSVWETCWNFTLSSNIPSSATAIQVQVNLQHWQFDKPILIVFSMICWYSTFYMSSTSTRPLPGQTTSTSGRPAITLDRVSLQVQPQEWRGACVILRASPALRHVLLTLFCFSFRYSGLHHEWDREKRAWNILIC